MSNIQTYGKVHSEQYPFRLQYTISTNYLLGGSLVMKNGKIDKILFDGGYAQDTSANSTTDKFAFYYYNQDHLGNNREVVDANGVVQQVTNYYPFGAPYVDATAVKCDSLQPYKYTGKELDLMHGLNTYDYGARQHDPILCRWDRIDPLCEKYYNVSPYAYTSNNPVNAIDPDGNRIIFVNGLLALGSPEGGSKYWNGENSAFVRNAQKYLHDNSIQFLDIDHKWSSTCFNRQLNGYSYAKEHYQELTKGMDKEKDKFNFVAHSMGCAFSAGMIQYLYEQGWTTENAVYFNAWQPCSFSVKKENRRISATCTDDPVQMLSVPFWEEPDVKDSDIMYKTSSTSDIEYIHRSLIDGGNIWEILAGIGL